jgi:amidase
MSSDIAGLFDTHDAVGLGRLVRQREIEASELVEEAIRRIERIDPQLNAVCLKTYDRARRAAKDPGLPDGPLKGVPFLLKDLGTLWKGLPTTNACPFTKDVVADADMEYVRRIKRSGVVLVGKSNSPEFGWSLATEPRLHGRTNNPWNLDVGPGGSSGGSAAAVAARLVPLADASDGGGSIRAPASHCGVVGLKPARGRITVAPQYGDFWYGAAVFLCVSRSVRDTATYLDQVHGRLPGDPYTVPRPKNGFASQAEAEPGTLRLSFTTRTPGGHDAHPEVIKAVQLAARLCEDCGHRVEERDLVLDYEPFWHTFVRGCAVQNAAAFADLAPLVGHEVREDEVSPVMWALIQRGRSVTAVQHSQDIDKLRRFGREVVEATRSVDAYIMPVVRHPARPHGYYDMYRLDLDTYNNERLAPDVACTAPFNVSGQPAISLPFHWTGDGLPVGVQLVGREGDEKTLLRLAGQLERAQPWRDRVPPIHA